MLTHTGTKIHKCTGTHTHTNTDPLLIKTDDKLTMDARGTNER